MAYTEGFAKKYIDKKYLKEFTVEKAYFNYTLERWMPQEYLLPVYNEDFVILTPRDILTKDENWINNIYSGRVLIIDMDVEDFVTDPSVVDSICARIDESLGRK